MFTPGLITTIGNELAPRLSPDYVVAVEERTYISALHPDTYLGRADILIGGPHMAEPAPVLTPTATRSTTMPVLVEVPVADVVTERYLEIRDVDFGAVITVIEILSPGNKRLGSQGYEEYQVKRQETITSRTNLVEIDLLRAGERPPLKGSAPASDYRIVVLRGWERPRGQLYPFGVRHPIPIIPIPLRRGEEEPLLDLNTLLHTLFDQAVYALRIDYSQPPTPPLSDADTAWAAELIQDRQP